MVADAATDYVHQGQRARGRLSREDLIGGELCAWSLLAQGVVVRPTVRRPPLVSVALVGPNTFSHTSSGDSAGEGAS